MSALDDVINDHNLSIRLHDYRMVSFQIQKKEIKKNKIKTQIWKPWSTKVFLRIYKDFFSDAKCGYYSRIKIVINFSLNRSTYILGKASFSINTMEATQPSSPLLAWPVGFFYFLLLHPLLYTVGLKATIENLECYCFSLLICTIA